MIEVVKDSVKKHLWCLIEECVVFGLFDEELDSAERRTMATLNWRYYRIREILHQETQYFPGT